ncbi:hypothetical protein H257_08940 [Aphanomyces astaci]|uniref:Uncharacterized protein n=1 Tax=Aphanomyces astaci TaxID=112090 RepID=W4GD76_APHAT|nr:hypothetical protein H257_08940 [Aphanomyces astaci]ETV77024.1 hypothetical protein H257_08940 [Aphanomyces astaci]|eukprot:XP_009833330.1 hypothetical protein H257_08940 [Aphanomyces astaci]
MELSSSIVRLDDQGRGHVRRHPSLATTRDGARHYKARAKSYCMTIAQAQACANIAFALLQNRSLLMAQQESHIMALVATISTMFDLELIDPDDADAEEHDNFGSMARDCLLRLDVADKTAALKQIVAYAETLVIEQQGVRAERDDSNLPREQDAPPVLPGQLVGLRPAHFFRDVLDLHRERILRFCTTFNDAWDVASHQWLRLRAFCVGLATIVPNTTSVQSDFSILKWEIDPNWTDLMHLSLEGIFQAKHRFVLQ